ncbi:LuxE/PaaK family acyltransferase [Pedobacter montanisoli]|uniref:Acyl transferase n=1 Tax=Pedobacter montanisoli TaxID=2923277 RepID=A0ABS9ZW07_9SPHI|nr:acyl transferase [Pedobacter montanisoli]MCJ0742486.1 acyl transferase [Pedobacter montanisoli]
MVAEQFFSIKSEDDFNKTALEVFNFQVKNCLIYAQYIKHLNINPDQIDHYEKIPFLPISFFKSNTVLSSDLPVQITFSSSGTTGQITSRHLVTDLSLYENSFNKAFELFYGSVKDICLLALLPSYLEREGSSLIYMVDDLLKQSQHPKSGYFLHNHEDLHNTLSELKQSGQKTILIGVTYALLDFIEQYQIDFPELIVMETGGMKGKRKEMVREELHHALCEGFGVQDIHSEYGMTELLSQAYSKGKGIFFTPPWMKVLLRDTSDPLSLISSQQIGGINVIDLANVNSCAFIATQDLGKIHNDKSFEVIGRFDNADIRGCNLLVQ